jgi:hypothetical protein
MGRFFGLLHTFEKQITQQYDIDNKIAPRTTVKFAIPHPILLVQVSPKATASYSVIIKTETVRGCLKM